MIETYSRWSPRECRDVSVLDALPLVGRPPSEEYPPRLIVKEAPVHRDRLSPTRAERFWLEPK